MMIICGCNKTTWSTTIHKKSKSLLSARCQDKLQQLIPVLAWKSIARRALESSPNKAAANFRIRTCSCRSRKKIRKAVMTSWFNNYHMLMSPSNVKLVTIVADKTVLSYSTEEGLAPPLWATISWESEGYLPRSCRSSRNQPTLTLKKRATPSKTFSMSSSVLAVTT